MKTLGLIGGTTWLSTLEYYRFINEGINKQLGDLNFSECIIYSFNFQDIKDLTDIGDWDSVYLKVLKAAKNLEKSGAKGIVLCANTLHYISDRLEK